MVNAYGAGLRERFAYCSDYRPRRHRRLRDVLEEAADERLHVLTHPEQVPEPLPPRARHACDRGTRSADAGALRPRVGGDPRARPQQPLTCSGARVPSGPTFISASTTDRPGTNSSPGCEYRGCSKRCGRSSIPARSNCRLPGRSSRRGCPRGTPSRRPPSSARSAGRRVRGCAERGAATNFDSSRPSARAMTRTPCSFSSASRSVGCSRTSCTSG